jgi:hypothetical protein
MPQAMRNAWHYHVIRDEHAGLAQLGERSNGHMMCLAFGPRIATLGMAWD